MLPVCDGVSDMPVDLSPVCDRLVGLMLNASASRAEDPGFESRLRRDYSGSYHTSDLKIGSPVATMSGSALGLVGPVSIYCDWM